MTIKVTLGIIDRLHVVDIQQTSNYIKLNNSTYIKKILAQKFLDDKNTNNLPLLMTNDEIYNRPIENISPMDKEELS